MLSMEWRQIIPLTMAAVVTFVSFIAGLLILIYGDFFKQNEILIYVSIAIGPLAVSATAIGYAVWWFATFIITLLVSGKDSDNHNP
jgi:hypothetical protein